MTTTAAPTSTATVAEELVSLCRAGRNLDAINTLYSPDIVSVESMGNETMPRETKGLDAIMEKNRWWSENNTVNSATIEGPFVGIAINSPFTTTSTSLRSQQANAIRWKRWRSTQ